MQKHNLMIGALFTACFSAATVAEEIILNGDGREIRLRDDGTWEIVSDNIYLDTSEGRRVVLTPDGRWRYVGLAPVVKDDQYRELFVEVTVASAVIKETREKVGSGKNVRSSATTQFELQVAVAKSASGPLELAKLNTADFSVRDNRGNVYPVLEVSAAHNSIAPGEQTRVQLLCEDAPSGFKRSKTLTITIAKQAFATAQPVQLEIEYDNIQRERINL